MASFIIWVRPEPFDFGICQLPPPSKLSAGNLHKLAAYAKSRGAQGWPNMSYRLWNHCACTKLHMNEDQAHTYFETFRLVWHEHNASEALQWAESYRQCKTATDRDHLVHQELVPVPEFLLYLHIQLSMKISLKSKLIFGDAWRSISDTHDKRSSTGKHHSSEDTHMDYISSHLQELVQLLVELDLFSSQSAAVSDQTITVDGISALEYLMGCELCSESGRNPIRLREVALLQSELPHCGYSKITQTFSVGKLVDWLCSHLSKNPYGVSSTITNRHKMASSLSIHTDGRRKGRMVSNVAFSPNDSKLVIFAHIKKLTVMKGEDELTGARIHIQACREAFVYLLAPLRHVAIEHCQNCTFVLGAVEGIVNMTHCIQCTVIAMCGQLQTRESTLCVLHLCTPCKPVFLGGNDNLRLAPYHTFYPSLDQHMARTGLTPGLNKWDSPIVTEENDEESPVYQLLPPDELYPFTVPYKMPGHLKNNPCPLPPQYADALAKRKRSLESWYQTVQEADLDSSQKQQLQSVVEAQFQEWLINTGNDIQLLNSQNPVL